MTGPRVKAMVIISRPSDGAILVARDADREGVLYERPLGGTVEFGELSSEAIRREVFEEIAEHIDDLRLLDVLENRFSLDGVAGHEIVFIYAAGFRDPAAYSVEEQPIRDDASQRIVVRWRTPGETGIALVPTGIERLLTREGPDQRS